MPKAISTRLAMRPPYFKYLLMTSSSAGGCEVAMHAAVAPSSVHPLSSRDVPRTPAHAASGESRSPGRSYQLSVIRPLTLRPATDSALLGRAYGPRMFLVVYMLCVVLLIAAL